MDHRSQLLEASDLYVSTSSAGGGLQMMVAGVVKAMSAESAERAAAQSSGTENVREIHEELARQYEALVENAGLRPTLRIVLPDARQPTQASSRLEGQQA